MAIGLQHWLEDGRERYDTVPHSLPYCKILGVTSSSIVIPYPEYELLKFPANRNRQKVQRTRRKKKLTWPQKFIAYQIGFTLESLIAALEKFVG